MEQFVKNQYYPGKLMHAGDFIHEQEYGNKKLEFVNSSFFGSGIIEGLQAEALAEGVRIKAGSAIDGRGRILTVPEDITAGIQDIEGVPDKEEDFILGITYAERTVETECDLLDGQKYRPARKAETVSFRAVEGQNKSGMSAGFWNEQVIHEDENLSISCRIPKFIPLNGCFKVCVETKLRREGMEAADFCCRVRSRGCRFAQTGMWEETPDGGEAILSGRGLREWLLFTQQDEDNSAELVFSELHIFYEKQNRAYDVRCRLCAQKVLHYDEEICRMLAAAGREEAPDWVPLAKIRVSAGKWQTDMEGVRRYAANPKTQAQLSELKNAAGIGGQFLYGGCPNPEDRIHRGVAVVEIPKRYRRGQVLYTGEIAHGFGAKETVILYGRVYEENNPAYWEDAKVIHTMYCGRESLFENGEGWKIREHALQKNVEEGTFQIALTLKKGRRGRGREVRISWMAILTGK